MSGRPMLPYLAAEGRNLEHAFQGEKGREGGVGVLECHFVLIGLLVILRGVCVYVCVWKPRCYIYLCVIWVCVCLVSNMHH